MGPEAVNNVILLADCYKVSHHLQYPPGITKLYSYFESRGGKFPYTVFFGLQYILKKWLVGQVVTKEVIQEAKEIYGAAVMADDLFNEEGWNYILEKHGGHLPVRIKAVAEGSIVPVKNVLFTVENTDPAVPWLTNYLETILVQAWYPMTVATISRIHKQLIHHYNQISSDDQSLVSFSLHDTGYRGVSSVETAAIGGAAHMINFKSSDTIAGSCLLRKYYHVEGVAGFSGPFSEHSTVTSWGRERENEAHKKMLKSFMGRKFGCVVDSYNIWECLEKTFGQELKDLVIENGSKGGMVAIRPDSGNPTEVVLKCLEILEKAFGTEKNSKGYKVLPEYIKVVQADGINYQALASILKAMEENGWAANNASFGAGAALLQRIDRDTQRCAYKCSMAEVNGEDIEVFKQPITDPGKRSKKGRLALHCTDGVYTTVKASESSEEQDQLVTVFENGELLKDFTFEEICQRAEISGHDIDILKFIAEDASE
ncbi:nicotinamide phosphoribosyltransferase-like isoform X1 [Macrobrachium nipponense]|uniref:nicotinamide phosphoribosyltransferase-like isoform X1 n=1 Tax=Macrobrachium nipponense TaxID=159736 RepID=UPI0030C85C7E